MAYTIKADLSLTVDSIDDAVAFWRALGGAVAQTPRIAVASDSAPAAALEKPSPTPISPPVVTARRSTTDELAELRPWFGQLSERARQIVELRVGGMKSADIAAKIGISVASAHTAVHEAKTRLRKLRDAPSAAGV